MSVLEEIREFCLNLKGTTEGLKWEDHLCFMVGEKMYIILSPNSVPIGASLKTTPEKFEEICSLEGIIPAPYLARNHWISIHDIEVHTVSFLKDQILQSYHLVFDKLPKKIKNGI